MENKKKVAAAVAAAIAASGAAVDASFDDPADLLQADANIEPQIQYVDLEHDSTPDDMAAEDEAQDRQGRTSALRSWILSLPLTVRTLFVLPFWFLGHLLILGGSALFTAASPLIHWFLGFLLIALVIAGAFTAAAKAMFPDLPIGKILNRHSIKWILIAAAAVWLADLLLGLFWPDYAHVRALVLGAFSLAAIGSVVVWFARRDSRRRARLAAEAAEAAAAASEPDELVYTSLGHTFTVRRDRDR